ncbi:MAG: hypothetical protein AAF621_05720 [Pseudomonadota bacterium]
MDTSQQLLFQMTSVEALDSSEDMQNYMLALYKLLEFSAKAPSEMRKFMVLGASQDMISRARQGTEFPFTNPSLLKLIKQMIVQIPPEALSAFSHILPENLQKALQPKTNEEHKSARSVRAIQDAQKKAFSHNVLNHQPSLKDQPAPPPQQAQKPLRQSPPAKEAPSPPQEMPIFLKEITEKFSVRALLPIFGVKVTDNEAKDRAALTPYFFVLQEALFCYNPESHNFDKGETYKIMCRLRGFVMMYYRKGASYKDALDLFTKLYPNNIGLMAKGIGIVNYGNFICGVACLAKMCQNAPDGRFISALYDVADEEGAYTLPSTFQPILIPSALPFPVAIASGGILSAQIPEAGQKFGAHHLPESFATINIDTGEGTLH